MASGLNVDIGVTLARLEREMAKVVKMGVGAASQVENRWEKSNQAWVSSTQRAGSQIQKIISQQTGAGGSTAGGFDKRAKQIEAFGLEMDKLRSKYDPVFAASKRYESAFNELNRAHKVGAINARQYEAALDQLNAEYAQAATASNVAADGTVRSFKRSGFAVANLSAQLNDIGVSLAGGQSPFQVMIQQGTQVSQIFQQTGGNFKSFTELLKGSVLGVINPFSIATFAIIGLGGALLQWMTATEDGSEKAKDAVEELRSAIDNYSTAAENASKSSGDLVEKYGDMAVEARELAEQQKKLAETEAIVAIEKAVQKVTAAYREYEAAVSSAARRGGVSIFENEPIENFAAALGVTEEQAAALGEKLKLLDAQTSVSATIPIVRELKDLLEQAGANTATASDEARTLYSDFLDVEDAALRLVSESRGLAPELERAADAARELESVMQAAADAAARMSTNARRAASGAKLRFEMRNDPVGLAGELSGRKFDRGVGDVTGFDPILQQGLENQKQEMIEYAEETERSRKALKDFNKEQREANKKPKKPKKTPSEKFGKREDSVEFSARNLEQQYEALLRIDPLLNDYGKALDYAKTRQRLLNDAEKAGLELTPERAAAIDALSERHAEAASKLKELQVAQENYRKSIEEFKSATKDVLKGFIGDLEDGKSATEALGNALEKMRGKFLDAGIDALVDAVTGGGSKPSFSPGGGVGGGLLSFIPKLFGFDSGGYTGKGADTDVAGYVHKNEFVFDAEATKRIGAQRLESIRKGYMSGGFTGANSARSVSSQTPGGGEDFINASVNVAFENGEFVPAMVAISGQVSGKQIKQTNDRFPQRASKQNVRGV